MANASRDYLEKVYSAGDLDELRDGYAAWAEQYDRDVMKMGYQTPGLIAGMVGRHVDPSVTPILDCGAGTGLVGLLLAGLGYRDVTAMDMSEDMLALASARGCYSDVQVGILGDELAWPDNHFAAAVAGGVFTKGHAPANAYDEIARVLRPGGLFIVSERVDSDANALYRERRELLEQQGVWRPVEESEAIIPFPLEPSEAHLRQKVFVYGKARA
jgi:SAM-dependent methyltransferase